MDEYIFSFVATLMEIALFAICFFIEKAKVNKKEDEEKSAKELKYSRNMFYIWTNMSIILSILIMLSVLCCEWHLGFLIVYGIFNFTETFISLIRLKSKKDCIKKLAFSLIVIVSFLIVWRLYQSSTYDVYVDKPIIYIYPKDEIMVHVSVGYPEKLSCVYPEYYEDAWRVIAKPDGELLDIKTGKKLYCLYWEGNQKQDYKFKDGFVVAGEDSAKFLEEKLAILGLNEREANEFIIYWLPKLEANKYNLIRFETVEEIEEYMPLNVEPKPDSLIRISMNFKGLNKPIEIEEQKLETPVREGYTVVEWGGSEF